MCLTVIEGEQIVAKAEETNLVVRVGFNRRFAPHLGALRAAIGVQGKRMLFCRVNVGALGNDWSNTLEQGGRFLGEGVHFLDFCNWFMGLDAVDVAAAVVGEFVPTNPDVSVQVRYASGCVAQILYTTLGHTKAGKEYFEAHGNGRTAICDDFRSFKVFGSNVTVSRKHNGDKGHLAELKEFAAAIQGKSYPVSGADARAGLMATQMALAVYCSQEDSLCWTAQ